MNNILEKEGISQPAALGPAASAEVVEFVSFSAIVDFIRENLIVIAASVGLCFLLGLIVVRNSQHIYEASVILSASQSNAGLQGDPIKSTASILRNFTLAGGSVTGRFTLFRQKLLAMDVAQRLMADYDFEYVIFQDQWDEKARAWRPPTGTKASFKRFVRGILGLPEWLPPSEETMLKYMESNIEAIHDTESDLLFLRYRREDPDFALNFLKALIATTDGLIREGEQAQTGEYIGYLNGRLVETDNVYLRNALTNLLVEQERKMMLSQSTLPFAAQTLDKASVSDYPVSPSITKTSIVFIGIGFILGFVLGLARMMLAKRRGSTFKAA